MTLDEESKIFVVHVAALEAQLAEILIYLLQKALIITLKQNEVFIKVSIKYSNFFNIFSAKEVLMLLKQTKLHKHIIELKHGKQPPYRSIYSLKPLELEILKTYIEIYLKTRFIQLSKSPVRASILFNKKPNCSFWLCDIY